MNFTMLSFFQEGLFKTNHILYLILSLIIVVTFLVLNKIKHFTLEQNLNYMVAIAIVNEITKILFNLVDTGVTTGLGAGGYLEPRDLPFQLCAFQLFLIIALKFIVKKDSTKDKILCFMVPTMMIGASISLFIPTDGTSITDPIVYRYFIYHASLIAFGIYIVAFKLVRIDFSVYLRNLLFLSLYFILCLWVNSALSYANTNFLFLRRPPMEGLPILNLNNGYQVYLLTILCLGLLGMTLIHLPFIIINRKSKCE